MGFVRAEDIAHTVNRWQEGQIAATRSDKARQNLGRMLPRFLAEISHAYDAIAAFFHIKPKIVFRGRFVLKHYSKIVNDGVIETAAPDEAIYLCKKLSAVGNIACDRSCPDKSGTLPASGL